MSGDSGLAANAPLPDQSLRQRVFRRPSTRLGWWAVALVAAFVVALRFSGALMMACGLAAGTVALIAVVWKRERSWLVWLALLPGLMAVVLLLVQLLVPH